MKHPYAELMLEYANDAMETDTPWKRWEYYTLNKTWSTLSNNPMWLNDIKYRRKKQTININGFEVPEPERKPLDDGTQYYVADPLSTDYLGDVTLWTNDDADNLWLKRGLAHLTKEAAIVHAKALLSFTQKGD